MSDNTKIDFIGFGNMAQAIADGLLSKNAAAAENIFACAANWEKLCRNTKKRGIVPCRDAAETAVNSDIAILAVKPYMMADVTSTVKSILKDKIVISVAAGYPFEKFEEILLPGTHHISTIPNTPVSVGEGIFICENRHSLSDNELALVENIFSKIALMQFVDTNQLSGSCYHLGGQAVCGVSREPVHDGGIGESFQKHAGEGGAAAADGTGNGKLICIDKLH